MDAGISATKMLFLVFCFSFFGGITLYPKRVSVLYDEERSSDHFLTHHRGSRFGGHRIGAFFRGLLLHLARVVLAHVVISLWC